MDQNKKLFHLATLANILVAAFYLVFRYFIRVETEFGEVPSNIQPWFQYFHIFLVIPWVFVLGMLSQTHVFRKLKLKKSKKRKSGITLLTLFTLMTFSGYAIQVTSPEWIGPMHVIISLVWICAYLWHVLRN